jgi:hypothetical protein
MKLFWFIPTHGDGRYLGTSHGGRPLDFTYLKQIACAVDNLGFYGALLPTGRLCEDAWITAASLIPETRRMRFLVPIRPGLIWPSLAARMTATFDRLRNGRLLINVVTNGLAVRRQFVFAPEHPDDVFAFEWHVQHHEIRQWADHNNSLAFLGILNQDSLNVLPIPALEEDQIPPFKIPNRYLFQVGIEIEALAALWHLEPILG